VGVVRQALDRARDARVKIAPPIARQAGVRDVVGEGVLEGVFHLGE
jgi:hypothetical protein